MNSTRPAGASVAMAGQGLALEAQLAVRVVLEDEDAVALAHLHQGPPLLERDGGAGGVLEVGDRVDQARHAAGGAGGGEGVHVQAVVLHGDRQHVHAVQPQLQERAVVGRRLDGHQVARLEQRLQQEHEALEGAVGDEHLVRATRRARPPAARAAAGSRCRCRRRGCARRSAARAARVHSAIRSPRGPRDTVRPARRRSSPRAGSLPDRPRAGPRCGSLLGRFFVAAALAALASFACSRCRSC